MLLRNASDLLRKLESNDKELPLLSFCSNDYLNLSKHEKVIKAFKKATDIYGLGSGSSAQISGYSKAHQQLEENMAAYLKRDKAILFNSGYHANIGVMTTYANRNSHVVLDKNCHASTVDGLILSRSRFHRYRHNDLMHAESLLKPGSILVTESVFSIQGNISDAKTLSKIAKDKSATLIIDDAHGFGILGKGPGIGEHAGLNQDLLPCLITPLGKALGSFGAIVSGSADMINALIQNARTHRYSTALPPAIPYATNAALTVLQEEPERLEHLQKLISAFTQGAHLRNLPLISNDETPIKSILTINNKRTLLIQEKLLKHGIQVACIRPPTVPLHEACIRISLNYAHTFADITLLLDLLKESNDDIK